MSENNSFEANPIVQENLERANKMWQIFSNTLNKTKAEPRISAILYHLVIEHYINSILILKSQMKKHSDRLRFDEKLERLNSLNFLTNDEISDFEKIYGIRNMYAHQIDISEEFIKHTLNSIKSISLTLPQDLQEKYFKISDIMMRKIQRVFMDLLVQEQEKFDEI